MNEIFVFLSAEYPSRWEWVWLNDNGIGAVVESGFHYASRRAAKSAGKREVAKLIKYCAKLEKSGFGL